MYNYNNLSGSEVVNGFGLLAFVLTCGFFAFLGAQKIVDAEIAYWVGQGVTLALAAATPVVIKKVNE